MENQIKSERSRRSQVLRADGDRIRDVILSRGNVAKVWSFFAHEMQQVLKAEGIRASMIVKAEGEAASKLMAAEAEKKSLEIIAKGTFGCLCSLQLWKAAE